MTRWVTIACVCACWVATAASPAQALEDYADTIADALELEDKPSCLFCHTRTARGLATDTPFNDALKDRGFSRRLGTPSLRSALTALETDSVDTDGDGVIDIDELTAGANPNDPRDRGLPPDSCSVSRIDHAPRALWLPLGLVWAWLCTRRLGAQRRR